MSTNIFEVFSTWKWVIPCLRAKTIPMYMPHISTWSVSHESILRAKLLKQLLLLCRRRHPHPTHISWTFVTVITIEFNPSFLRLIPPNKNSIFSWCPPPFEWVCMHLSIFVAFLRMTWIGLLGHRKTSSKILMYLQIHKYQHVTMKIVWQPLLCARYIIEDPVPASYRKKRLVKWLEAISLIQIWVAMMQSHRELFRLLAHKQDT
jgi:hypothetical protein